MVPSSAVRRTSYRVGQRQRRIVAPGPGINTPARRGSVRQWICIRLHTHRGHPRSPGEKKDRGGGISHCGHCLALNSLESGD